MHGNAKIDSDTFKITPTHAVFHIHRLPKKIAECNVKPKLYKLVDTILQVMTVACGKLRVSVSSFKIQHDGVN